MEKFAILMTYSTGHKALVTSGNHQGRGSDGKFHPPAAPYYGREEADMQARHFARLNAYQDFEVVPYPANPYDTGIKDPEVGR